MLVRLLYASRAAGPLTQGLIDSILAQSRRRNPDQGITGILCYSDDIFLQVLEGGRDAVCEVFNTIVADPRHTSVRLLQFEEIGGSGSRMTGAKPRELYTTENRCRSAST